MNNLHPKQLSRAEILAEIEAAGGTVKGRAIRCPFHEDRSPSAGVYQGKDGAWRFKCHSCNVGGDVFDLEARRTGRPLAEILKQHSQGTAGRRPGPDRRRPSGQGGTAASASTRPSAPAAPSAAGSSAPAQAATFDSIEGVYGLIERQHGGQLEALHEYTTGDGEHVQFVVRWRQADGKKTIRPCVETAAGFALRFPDERVLYNLPSAAQADTVVVVEGESKVDLLADFGFVGTCSAGGSKAAGRTSWRPLAGKNIVIWPDHDTAGQGYAADVKTMLDGLGCSITIVDPARLDLTEGEDSVDFVQQLKNAGYNFDEIREKLARVFEQAQGTGPAADLATFYRDIIEGRIDTVPTGHSILEDMIQILPGGFVVLCGNPGSGKSLYELQWIAYLIGQEVKTACLMIERDRNFHLARVLAQTAGVSQLTRIKWIASSKKFVGFRGLW